MSTRRRRGRVLYAVQPRQGAVSTQVSELVRTKSSDLLNALGIAPLPNDQQRMHAVLVGLDRIIVFADLGRTIVFAHVWNVGLWEVNWTMAARKLEGALFREILSLDGGYSRRFEWQGGPWCLKFILHSSPPPGDLNFSRQFDKRWGLFWIGQEAPVPAAR